MPQVAGTRTSFETMSIYAIIATLIVATFLAVPSVTIPFLATKSFVVLAGAILALALFILARLTRGNAVLPPMLLVGALWLPAVAYALSTAFVGAHPSLAIFGAAFDTDTLGFVLAATMLGTLAALAVRRTGDYRMFFTVLGYGAAVLIGLETLILLVGQVIPTTISPSFSLAGSYTDVAAIAGLALTLGLLALRLADLAPRVRTGLYVLGALELLILALANNTVLWVLAALTALALFVESVMRRGTTGGAEDDFDLSTTGVVQEAAEGMAGERKLAGPLVVLAVALFFIIGPSLGSAFAGALHVNVLEVRPSWQSTLTTAGSVYHSSPLFGAGPGSFGTAWLASRDASLNSTVFWNVDFPSGIGYIPTSFVTTGLVGALAWLVLLGSFLVLGMRALLMRTPEEPTARLAALVSFVGFVYLAALAIFSEPGPAVLVLLFVFAGVFASTLRYARGGTQWGVQFGKSPKIGFAIVFVLTLLLLGSVGAAYATVERYVAQVELTRAQAAYTAGNVDAALTYATTAIGFAPTPSAYEAQASLAAAKLSQIANDSKLSATDAQQQFQAALTGGINAAITATQLAPKDYSAWVALGNLYASAVPLNVDGAYDSAKSAYQKAAVLNPTSPNIPYLMAQLDIAHKDNAAAIADLKQAITLKQDDTRSIFLLSQLEVAAGNLKDALAAAEAAAYFTPTDQNVLFQLGLLRAASGNMQGAVQALSAAVAQNANFANARYFLAAAYANLKDYANATAQLQAVSDMSADNAKAVEADLATLKAGKNPFPASLLAAPQAPLTQ